MGKSQRTKGHSFERKVARDLQEIGFKDARRQLEYHDDDANGVDIQGSGDYRLQCKSMKKMPNIPKVFSEFQNLDEDDIPVVVFKVDRKGEYACFKWSDAQVLMAWMHQFQSGNLPEA